MNPPSPDRRRLSRVLALLVRAHGPRQWRRRGTALDVLVGTILSQNTSGANSSAAFRQLTERFSTWDAAADAPVRTIERCIRVSGLSRIKAPRIRRILRQIRRERGRMDLQFLNRLGPQEAYRYLLRFDGVGPKTANCVLLFAFAMPVLPVDTHVHRLAKRLGWVARTATPTQTQEILTPRIAPQHRYAMHVLLIAHGRSVCLARRPRCRECVLAKLCPSAAIEPP